MDRYALAELSREQLIELVRGLAAEVAELKAQQGQTPKTGNLSVPSSVGFKASRVEWRARKRRRGYDGVSHRRQAPDPIVRCRPRCRGESLPAAGQRRVGRSQVVELSPMRSVVVEAWLYTARCGGVRPEGANSAGLEPTRTFGPQVEALLGYFHERHHVDYEGLVEVCRGLFGGAVHLHQIRGSFSPASFIRRRRRIENAVDRLVLGTFLNASEQDICPSVIYRRAIGGFCSQLGAEVSAILSSLLTTAWKRGENLFQALRAVAGPSPLDACSGSAFVEARAG